MAEITSVRIPQDLSPYLLKAGDTMTGTLNMGANLIAFTNTGLLQVGSSQIRVTDQTGNNYRNLSANNMMLASGAELSATDPSYDVKITTFRPSGRNMALVMAMGG